VSPITDFPYVYHIRFELEQILDHGERIVYGVVVNLANSVTSPSKKQRSSMRDGDQNKNVDIDAGLMEGKYAYKMGQRNSEALNDVEKVPSSQAKLDKQMEKELRDKMLLKRINGSKTEKKML
jgi:hypothetical protein